MANSISIPGIEAAKENKKNIGQSKLKAISPAKGPTNTLPIEANADRRAN